MSEQPETVEQPKEKPLSPKQKAFVDEYLKCRNAAEAARRAGYAEKNARVIGAQNLSKLNIAAEIQRRTKEKAMEADEVLSRLADMARGSMEDFTSFNEGPYPTATLDLDKARRRGVLHLIKKLKYNAEGHPEIELYNAKEALDSLGKFHKLYADVNVDVNTTLTFTSDEAAQAANELDKWKQQNSNRPKSNG